MSLDPHDDDDEENNKVGVAVVVSELLMGQAIPA